MTKQKMPGIIEKLLDTAINQGFLLQLKHNEFRVLMTGEGGSDHETERY